MEIIGHITKTSMAFVGHFMVKMYLNNILNSFIDFPASDWYNKIPISLFERPETLIFTISWFLNPSPSTKTKSIYLWRHQDALNKLRTNLWTSWKHIIFGNMRRKHFEHFRIMCVPNFLKCWMFFWNFDSLSLQILTFLKSWKFKNFWNLDFFYKNDYILKTTCTEMRNWKWYIFHY